MGVDRFHAVTLQYVEERAQHELDAISHRLSDLRHTVTEREHALRDVARSNAREK